MPCNCNKLLHESAAGAKRHLRWSARKGLHSGDMHIYACPDSSGWHIGRESKGGAYRIKHFDIKPKKIRGDA